MSKINDTINSPPPPTQWRLRSADGSVFGPVSSAQLGDWAEQGRIAPGHEVSDDGQKWVPAESVSFLQMVWRVQVAGGEIGPVNIHALADLLNDGTVAPAARLVNIVTGEVTTAAQKEADIRARAATKEGPDADESTEALRKQLQEERARHQERLAEFVKRIQALEKELKLTAEQADRLRAAGVQEHERFTLAHQQGDAEAARLREKAQELERQRN